MPVHLSLRTVALADLLDGHESLVDLLTASEHLASCLTPVRSSKQNVHGTNEFLNCEWILNLIMACSQPMNMHSF